MAETEQRIVSGRCPNHGIVQATKTLPKIGFPWIVNAVRRTVAGMAPAKCPECGAKLGKA